MAIRTPLQSWLADHLPDVRPDDMPVEQWDLVRRLGAGEEFPDLIVSLGMSRGRVESLARAGAKRLGYPGAGAWAAIQPDGHLAAHAVDRDETTGCWRWTGRLEAGAIGPFAHIPATPGTGTGRWSQGPIRNVRQWLWEREHGTLPASDTVVAHCGDRRCVNPAHGEVRGKRSRPLSDLQRSVADRRDLETAREAIERTGYSIDTVKRLRRPGGKREPTGPLQRWLQRHLPAERPPAMSLRHWTSATRHAAGDSMRQIAQDDGVSRQMVHVRVRRVALQFGWSASEIDRTEDGA